MLQLHASVGAGRGRPEPRLDEAPDACINPGLTMALEPFVVCALQEVYDPEVGVNIVDLGLVYGVAEQDGHVRVLMTMTHRGGPLTRYITGMAEATVRQTVSGVKSVKVDLVWDPPWSPAMAAESARQRLLAI